MALKIPAVITNIKEGVTKASKPFWELFAKEELESAEEVAATVAKAIAAKEALEESAVAVSTSSIASLSGEPTVDGVTVAAGQIVLLTGQTEKRKNGPWVVASGAWARPSDFAAGSEQFGTVVPALQGTAHAGSIWVLENKARVTVETTEQEWEENAAASAVPTFNVWEYGAKGDGTNQTAAVKKAIEAVEAHGGGRLVFGIGTYQFSNLTFGTTSTLYPLIVEGQGRKTLLQPVPGTGRMLTVKTKIGSGSCVLQNFSFGFTAGEKYDFPYTEPFIEIVNQEEQLFVLNVTGLTEGTGTMLKTAACWNYQLSNLTLRAGRYAVGWELGEDTVNQEDTFIIVNSGIQGSFPVTMRNITDGLHGLGTLGFKLTCESTDRGKQMETFLVKTATAGETAIYVAAEEEGTEKIEAGMPIGIGVGEHFEVNRVEAVKKEKAGEYKLTLAQKLQFTHTLKAQKEAGRMDNQVLTHSVGISCIGLNNAQFVTSQIEGFGTGIMPAHCSSWTFDNMSETCPRFIRPVGPFSDITFNQMEAIGGHESPPELKKNSLVFFCLERREEAAAKSEDPAYRLHFNGPFDAEGGQALVLMEGTTLNVYDAREPEGAALKEVTSVYGNTTVLWEVKTAESGKVTFKLTGEKLTAYSISVTAGGAFWGVTPPASQHAAIAAVTGPGTFKSGTKGFETEAEAKALWEKVEGLVTAVAALREVVKEYGQTA